MNTTNFNRLIEFIKKQPDIDMSVFATPCGTVGCIAGNCVLLQSPERFKELARQYYRPDSILASNTFEKEAIEFLGVSEKEGQKLFYHSEWPDKFELAYRKAADGTDNKEARKSIVIERLQYFMEHGE